MERSQHATAADEHDEFHSEMGRNRDGLAVKRRRDAGRGPEVGWNGNGPYPEVALNGEPSSSADAETDSADLPLDLSPDGLYGFKLVPDIELLGRGEAFEDIGGFNDGSPWDRRVAPGRASRVAMLKTVRPGSWLPSCSEHWPPTLSMPPF